MDGQVELLLRRADGANVLVITEDELTGRGMVLAAITTAALNHGQNLQLLVADFLPPETGFSESVAALEACGAVTVTRRRQFDKLLHKVKRIVSDRHATAALTEPPVLLVVAGIVMLLRRSIVLGIVLIIVGLLVGPGGVSIFS